MVTIRSVIRNGNSLQITLPLYWTEMHNINRGEKLMVRVNLKGELIVKPPKGGMEVSNEA